MKSCKPNQIQHANIQRRFVQCPFIPCVYLMFVAFLTVFLHMICVYEYWVCYCFFFLSHSLERGKVEQEEKVHKDKDTVEQLKYYLIDS